MAEGPLGQYIDGHGGEEVLASCASLECDDLLPKHDNDSFPSFRSSQLYSPGSASPNALSAAPALESSSRGNMPAAEASTRWVRGRLPRDESVVVLRPWDEHVQRQNGAANELASDRGGGQGAMASGFHELRESFDVGASQKGPTAGAAGEMDEEDDPTLLVPVASFGGARSPRRGSRRDEPRGPDLLAPAFQRSDPFDDFLNDSPKRKARQQAGRAKASEPTITVLSEDSKSCEPSQGASPVSLGCPVSLKPKPSVLEKDGRRGKEGQRARASKPLAPPAAQAVEVLDTSPEVAQVRNKGYNLRQAERNKGEEEEELRRIYWEMAGDVVAKLQTQVLEYPRNTEDSVQLTAKDLQHLEPGGFLNDVIIQFYLRYLQEKRKLQGNEEVKCYFFNTFFYTKLTEYKSDASKLSAPRPAAAVAGDALAPGMRTRSNATAEEDDFQIGPAAPTKTQLKAQAAFQRVRRWTKHVNIFDFDFIFIPVNMEEHWSLVVACHFDKFADWIQGGDARSSDEAPKPFLVHLDSLSQHRNVSGPIRSYFVEAFLAQNEGAHRAQVESAAKRIRCTAPQVPKQDNFSDCGVFVLKYVEMFLRDHAVPWSSSLRGPHQDQPEWFDPTDVGPMRFLILFLVRWIRDKEAGGDAGPEPEEEHVKALLEERMRRAPSAQQKQKPEVAALSTTPAGKGSAQGPTKRAPRASKPAVTAGKSLIDYALQTQSVSTRPGLASSPDADLRNGKDSLDASTAGAREGERSEAGSSRDGAQGTATLRGGSSRDGAQGTVTLRGSCPPQSSTDERRRSQRELEGGASGAKDTFGASEPMWGKAAWRAAGGWRAATVPSAGAGSTESARDQTQHESARNQTQHESRAAGRHPQSQGAPGELPKQRFDPDVLETAYNESLRPDNPFAGKAGVQEDLSPDHSGGGTGTGAWKALAGSIKLSLGEDVEVSEQPQGKPAVVDELRLIRRSTARRGGRAGPAGTRANGVGTLPGVRKEDVAQPLPPRPTPAQAPTAQAESIRPGRSGFQVPKIKKLPGAQGLGRGAPATGRERPPDDSLPTSCEERRADAWLGRPGVGERKPLGSPEGPGEEEVEEVASCLPGAAAGARVSGKPAPAPSLKGIPAFVPAVGEQRESSMSPSVPTSHSSQPQSEGLEAALPECQPSPVAAATQGSDPVQGVNVGIGNGSTDAGGLETPAMLGAASSKAQAEGKEERASKEEAGGRPASSRPKKHKGWQEGALERKALRHKTGSAGALRKSVGPVTNSLLQRAISAREPQEGEQTGRKLKHADSSLGIIPENLEPSRGIGGAPQEAGEAGSEDEASEDCLIQGASQGRALEGAVGGKEAVEAAGRAGRAEDVGARERGQGDGGRDADGEVIEVASTGPCVLESFAHGAPGSRKPEGRAEGKELFGSGGSPARRGLGMRMGKKRHLGELSGSPGGKPWKGSPNGRQERAAAAQAEESGEDVTEVLHGKGSPDEVREIEAPSPGAQAPSKGGKNVIKGRDVSEPKRRMGGPHARDPDHDGIALGRSLSTSSAGREGFCALPLGQKSARLWVSGASPSGGEKERAPGLRAGERGDSSPNGLVSGRPMATSAQSPTTARAGDNTPPHQREDAQKKRKTGPLPPAALDASLGEGAAFRDELSMMQGAGGSGRKVRTSSLYEDWGNDATNAFMNGGRGAKRAGTPFRATPSHQRSHEQPQGGEARAGPLASPSVYHTPDESPSGRPRQSSRIQENGRKHKEKEERVRDTITSHRGRKRNGQSRLTDVLRHASNSRSSQHVHDLTSDDEG